MDGGSPKVNGGAKRYTAHFQKEIVSTKPRGRGFSSTLMEAMLRALSVVAP
jgi:hypothetical protein